MKNHGADLVIVDLKAKFYGTPGYSVRYYLTPNNRVVKRPKRTIYYDIPKGKDGYVPIDVLRKRSAARSAAARAIDNGRNAKRIYPSKMTPSQAQSWYRSPNRSDVSGVDTEKKANYKFKTKELKERKVSTTGPRSSRKQTVTRDQFEAARERVGNRPAAQKVSDADWKDIIIPWLEDNGIGDYLTEGQRRNRTWRHKKAFAVMWYRKLRSMERKAR